MTAANAADPSRRPRSEVRSERVPATHLRSTASPTRAIVSSLDGGSRGLSDAWDDLAANALEANAFAERWFVMAAARHLSAGGAVHLVQVWDDLPEGSARLLALMPVRIAPNYGRSPVRHVTNWRHHHCFLGTPLIRHEHGVVAWRALLSVLDEAEWACGFFHLSGIVEDGATHQALQMAAAEMGRPCDTVHGIKRALLATDLSPHEYYERTVRKKKRKELNRLSCRLAELGNFTVRHLAHAEEVGQWCDAFLELEAAGWKGKGGTALASHSETELFFRTLLHDAFAAGRLEMLRLELDGRALAILVNFITPPGSFSFKIAFDESYARFSPGVLLQLENLQILDRHDIEWMDSCAVEDHPMINSLWSERRSIIRVTVPLSGWRRGVLFRLCRLAETTSATLRQVLDSLRSPRPQGVRSDEI